MQSSLSLLNVFAENATVADIIKWPSRIILKVRATHAPILENIPKEAFDQLFEILKHPIQSLKVSFCSDYMHVRTYDKTFPRSQYRHG